MRGFERIVCFQCGTVEVLSKANLRRDERWDDATNAWGDELILCGGALGEGRRYRLILVGYSMMTWGVAFGDFPNICPNFVRIFVRIFARIFVRIYSAKSVCVDSRATKIDAHREWFREIPPHSASLSQAHCAMFAEQCSVFTSTHATENYCCLWTKFRSRARVVCIMAVAHEVICQMKFIAISSDGNYIHQESCTRSKAAAVENKKFKIGLNERSTQWIQIIVVALGWRLYAVPVDVNVKSKHSKATINSTVFFFCFLFVLQQMRNASMIFGRIIRNMVRFCECYFNASAVPSFCLFLSLTHSQIIIIIDLSLHAIAVTPIT